MRFHIIMKKALLDMMNPKRTILYLGIILLIPFIFTIIAENETIFDFASMSLPMQMQMITSIFIITSFIWIAGIPMVVFASANCGSFISREDETGTLLILVSKPIRRWEIMLGKFLAFMIVVTLLELTSILASLLLLYYRLPLDPMSLTTMLNIVPQIFFYSLFVAFVFASISAGLSAFFKNRTKILITLIAMVILIYFGFMVIRNWTEASGIYEYYGFNMIDVNYHLGNAYVTFLQSSGYRIIPPFQGILGTFTGTHESMDPIKVFDQDIGAMPPEVPAKNYVSPAVSISLWLALAFSILSAGIIWFQRKEIM